MPAREILINNSRTLVTAPGEPVFSGEGSSTTSDLSVSSQPLSAKKIETVSIEEGDYFLIRTASCAFDPDLNFQESLVKAYCDLDLLASTVLAYQGVENSHALRDHFLKMENIDSSVRSERLVLCLTIASITVMLDSDQDAQTETFAMRAYRDIGSDTPAMIRDLFSETLFAIYDKAGEPELAISYQKKMSVNPMQQWVSGIVFLGMEERYRQGCDPISGLSS